MKKKSYNTPTTKVIELYTLNSLLEGTVTTEDTFSRKKEIFFDDDTDNNTQTAYSNYWE